MFECIATGLPDIQFLGWEAARGGSATGEEQVTADRRTDDAVISARLNVADFDTCQQDGGYVCVFDDGDTSNTVRSSVINCPGCKLFYASCCF